MLSVEFRGADSVGLQSEGLLIKHCYLVNSTSLTMIVGNRSSRLVKIDHPGESQPRGPRGFYSLVVGIWLQWLRLRLRSIPYGLHSVREGPDDRSQPCVSDVDSPVMVHLFDLSSQFCD